jgi:serine/threonine-protein kinase RsbW
MADTGERIAFTSAAVPEVLDVAHEQLEALWTRHPEIPEHERARFETGLVEVLGNVAKHAFALPGAAGPPGSPSRQLSVVVHVGPGGLEAVVEDDGRPVEVDLSAVTMPGPDAESGRGLALAVASLDELEYSRQDGRNRWRIRCVC